MSDTAVTLGHRNVARLVVLTDVTETESQRRELDRQNDQLEDFAAAIRHELLNTLQIVSGRVTLAGEDLERGEVGAARDSLRTASASAQRMSAIVDDLATLARHGQTLEKTSSVGLRRTAEDAWHRFAAEDLSLTVTGDGDVEGDGNRLHGLFASAFAFAHHNGATSVVVDVLEDGFSITDNGAPVDAFDADEFFQYGVSVPNAAAGMLLPNLRTLVRTHGWDADIDTAYTGGVRVVVSGASVAPRTGVVRSD